MNKFSNLLILSKHMFWVLRGNFKNLLLCLFIWLIRIQNNLAEMGTG